MRRVLLWGIGLCVAAGAAIVAVDYLMGPWEPVELSYRDPGVPGIDGVEAWLAGQEAAVPNVRSHARKAIIWAGEPARRTPFSVVYVHGFSAAAPEMRPVPDDFAAALGANLHFTRLAGHGRDGDAMAEPGVRDWADDLAEAIAVGRTIGERVIVMGSSMGGALVTLAALDPAYGRDVAGLALVSPAYRLPSPAGRVITLPFARQWGPLLLGETRVVTPRSPDHGAAWTLTYPMVSVLPLGALVRTIGARDKGTATIPAIFFFSDRDQVVDASAIREAANDWGAEREMVPMIMGDTDDTSSHVIAGDILSPGQNELMLRRLLAWARGL